MRSCNSLEGAVGALLRRPRVVEPRGGLQGGPAITTSKAGASPSVLALLTSAAGAPSQRRSRHKPCMLVLEIPPTQPSHVCSPSAITAHNGIGSQNEDLHATS